VIPLLFGTFFFITFKLLGGFAFGEYIYSGLALTISSSMTDPKKYDFIKSISSKSDYRIIRFAEQLIIFSPFIIGYFIFGWYFLGAILLLTAIVISVSYFNFKLPYSLPTPYGHRPFEFTRGFRGGVLLIIAAYILVPIGISVDNFNLSLSSITVIGLISGNYFIQPEPRFYIWIHSIEPKRFLIEKTKTILYYGLMTIAPIVITLSVYDASRIGSIVLITLAMIAFIEMCMLAKYIAYPSEINLVAGLAMVGSILFPPLMLVIIPIFYIKAVQRLEQYLR